MYDFTPEQQKFLSSSGKVLLHACPGSGKTTVVAQKVINYIKEWNKPHQGVAVLSFTNVASEEILRQSRELLPSGQEIDTPHFIGTLDSFIDNYIFLRFGYLLLSTPKRPIVVTSDISNNYRFWRRECHQRNCVLDIDQFKWSSEGVLTKGGEPVSCAGSGRYGPPCLQFKKRMLDNGMFFQNEIAGLSCIILKKYPEVARSVATRFPIIILDEAQDTSVEQMAILDLLCDAGMEALYIVGDPDQSIYEWRTADPESFLKKMNDTSWTQLSLSKNFRSSQLICDATYVFSEILKDGQANEAIGNCAKYGQKPIVLLYGNSVTPDLIVGRFKELCTKNNISITPENVAVVTRRKIHSNYDVKDLWKSSIVEALAQASYEWQYGNRKKAYAYCEKAVFQLVIKPVEDIKVSIEEDVEKVMSYKLWKAIIIDMLIHLPTPDEQCGVWVTKVKSIISKSLESFDVSLREGITIDETIKIKSRDSQKPDFKTFPVRVFFEKKNQENYTRASVHGVKGETFDALLLLVEGTTGSTLTPSFLAKGDTSKELMRIAYVAMTRPRKLLVVAMPKSSADLNKRFPKEKWEYIEL